MLKNIFNISVRLYPVGGAMPYSQKHKAQTRAKIIEAARVLFNHHGFQAVTIDMIMEKAGLTRGGFYNHFKSNDALFSAAIEGFLHGRGAEWRDQFSVTPDGPGQNIAHQMVLGYLSKEHLDNLDAQCPMIALPSDAARENVEVRSAYQLLLESMVFVFESGLQGQGKNSRQEALAMAALCVGGMILARTLPENELADEVRMAALNAAHAIVKNSNLKTA
jgi:AcrR family transcriptional regulator